MDDRDDYLAATLTASRREIDVERASAEGAVLARSISAPQTSRPCRRRVIGTAAAIMLTVPTTAAAAWVIQARTGVFGDPRTTEEVVSSEWLNMCAANYPDIVRAHAPTQEPLPGGVSWKKATTHFVELTASNPDCAEGAPGIRVQEIGIDSDYMFWGYNAWYCAGLEAIDTGDRAGWNEAAEQLTRIDRKDLMARVDGGGVREQNASIAAAIGRGQPIAFPGVDCGTYR